MAVELERCLAMNSHRNTITAGILWLLLSLITPSTACARELVLVASATSDLKPLSLFEVRKIFLGHPVKRDDRLIRAIRNKSDSEGYQIFLQKLIHLSAKNYERRLMSKMFRTGTATVSVASTLPSLKATLLNDGANVSVMWLDDVESDDDLTVIQMLWRDVN